MTHTCLGITNQGNQCKREIRRGKYCVIHSEYKKYKLTVKCDNKIIKYIVGTTKSNKNKTRNSACCYDMSYVFYILLWPIELFRIIYKNT